MVFVCPSLHHILLFWVYFKGAGQSMQDLMWQGDLLSHAKSIKACLTIHQIDPIGNF